MTKIRRGNNANVDIWDITVTYELLDRYWRLPSLKNRKIVWTVCGRSWQEIGAFSSYCEACLPRMPRSDINQRRSKLLFPALEFGSLHAVITPL